MAAGAGFPYSDFDLSRPISSFANVVRGLVLEPRRFFAAIPPRRYVPNALAFALICVCVFIVLEALLQVVFVPSGVEVTSILVLWSVVGVLGLLVQIGAMHLLVRLVTGEYNSGLEATTRIVAYSVIVCLVAWLPYIGMVLSLYGLYLASVGIREMHRSTIGQAVLITVVSVAISTTVLLTMLFALRLLGVICPPWIWPVCPPPGIQPAILPPIE